MGYRWVIDLGNTRVKLGRFRGGDLLEAHTRSRTELDETFAWLMTESAEAYVWLNTGEEPGDWRARLSRRAPLWQYTPGAPCPLTVRYATPETLGVDRLAAAVGAHAIFPATELLVIDAGTCITYEYVSVGGAYLGGNIAPGLRMRLRAMHAFTGKLPLVEQVLPQGDIGDSTASALQNGALRGAAKEVSGWVSAFRQNHPRGRVVVCGGDDALLRPLLPSGLTYRPNLVLEGLAQLHAYAHDSAE